MLEVMCGTRPLDVTAMQRGEGVSVDRVWRAHEAGNILQVAESRLGTFPLSNADSNSSGGIKFQEECTNLHLVSFSAHGVHAIYHNKLWWIFKAVQ